MTKKQEPKRRTQLNDLLLVLTAFGIEAKKCNNCGMLTLNSDKICTHCDSNEFSEFSLKNKRIIEEVNADTANTA
jgi:RNA polymerase subunit RPABC4/transcription elongation factor Spt4